MHLLKALSRNLVMTPGVIEGVTVVVFLTAGSNKAQKVKTSS